MKKRLIFCGIAVLCFVLVAISSIAHISSLHKSEISKVPDLAVYDGGWAIDDKLAIDASKNSKVYWITLQKLEGHYPSGMPIYTRIKTLSIPIAKKDDYIARGNAVCYRKGKGFPDPPIVVLLKQNKPVNAWIVSGKDFAKINPSSVICETEEHLGS